MIRSAKDYTKKQWTDRTLGQMVKANLYRQNHRKKHTHTHKKRKMKKNIYIYKRKRETKSINKSTNDNKL